eukprot:5717184-Amphidinium_carterae.1
MWLNFLWRSLPTSNRFEYSDFPRCVDFFRQPQGVFQSLVLEMSGVLTSQNCTTEGSCCLGSGGAGGMP